MKEKKLTIFMVFVSIMLCASIAISGFTLYSQKTTADAIDKFTGSSEDVDQEDDVTIAGNYVIKSTLNISDAYKSGDTSKLDETEKETLDMAKEIIAEVITDKMTDFEKEKAIYDWLTAQLTQNTGILTVIPTRIGDSDNPHDVLKYRTAVCVGYATTFRMFMQMFDIECKVVHSSDLTHSWDLVKLDDGWYHTDCYMDSESNNYQNFNMDDARCSQGHDWTKEYFPAATGKKYNYIFSICDELENIYSVPKWLTDAIINRKSVISCTFKEEITEKTETTAQFMVQQLMNQLDMGDNYSLSFDWMLNDKGKYVLCFYINFYNNNEVKVDKKTEEKVNDAVNKAMSEYYERTAVG
ncbi:MAG: transglutaminase domain-containing protein [Ruminococcaceae bacterium]|nr:transglutaminase domain-containing protein [Oscillospiraceae bacterium]